MLGVFLLLSKEKLKEGKKRKERRQERKKGKKRKEEGKKRKKRKETERKKERRKKRFYSSRLFRFFLFFLFSPPNKYSLSSSGSDDLVSVDILSFR